MKNKTKFRKKFIFAAVSLLLVVGILTIDLARNATVAEAKQNVFHSMVTYQQNGLKVLEITPTSSDKDLGYYFKKGTGDVQYLMDLTNGTLFNKGMPNSDKLAEAISNAEAQVAQDARNEVEYNRYPNWERNNQNLSAEEKQAKWQEFYDELYAQYYRERYQNYYNTQINNLGLWNLGSESETYLAVLMRSYGLIKPVGMDAIVGTVSEYPIYAKENKALFALTDATGQWSEITAASTTLVQGHYEMNTTNTGTYNLLDGYYIGTGAENLTNAVDEAGQPLTVCEQYQIYKVEEVVDATTDTSVSENTLSGNTVASPNGDPTDPTKTYKYTKINHTAGLPEGVELASAADGNLNFVYQANKEDKYYGYSTEKLLYLTMNKKLALGDWITEYVMGDATKYTATYSSKTIDQVTAADIEAADLIYISGTAEQYAAVTDISEDMVKVIYDASAINHKAVMMDYAVYSDTDAGLSNLDKLALLLWQEDQTKIADSYASFFTLNTDNEVVEIGDIAGLLASDAAMNSLKGTKLNGYNGNFAVNNVYVYNHHWQDFQNSRLASFQRDAKDVFANGDLKSPYSAAAVSGGFQSVVAYITYNNKLNVDDGNGTMTEGYVTPAIAIQYILSYSGENLALAKDVFSVLEIQPTKEFKFNSTMETKDYALETAAVRANRDTFISNCVNQDIVASGTQDFITFESITIDQYNTMEIDVLNDYDVIYIGDENSKYYKHIKGKTSVMKDGAISIVEDEITQYNDTDMYGFVYYNYGDIINNTGSILSASYSSRDLTEAKLIDLKNYLQMGGLIIVDEDMMRSLSDGNTIINPTKVDSPGGTQLYDRGRVDPASNMYELLSFARGYTYEVTTENQYVLGGTDDADSTGVYYNLVSEGDLRDGYVDKETALIYLNRERVSLRMLSTPKAYYYTSGSSESYVQSDNDGKFYLDYEFIIDNSTAIVDASSLYLIHFYQDLNADGRFAEVEEKVDYEISLVADDSEVVGIKGEDGVTRYNLNNGVAYKLRREVPADEGGIINWCIKVEKVGNANINCTETGFAAVKPKTTKYINVLQIIPDNNATVNLEALTEEDALYQWMNDPAVTNEYQIEVRTVTASQFENDTKNYYTTYRNSFSDEATMWQEFFATFERAENDNAGYSQAVIDNDEGRPMNVNMIVLGFGDSYTEFSTSFPTNALKHYMDTNRSLLTSNNVVNQIVYKEIENTDGTKSTILVENAELLSYFGQDRYGYTNPVYFVAGINTDNYYGRAEQTAFDTYIAPRELGTQAVAYTPGSTRSSVHLIPNGYTNTVAAAGRENTSALEFIATASIDNLYKGSDPTASSTRTYVDMANEGQVALYPFTIGDDALLSKSHAQYFQLDLDSDSDMNGSSDAIVWYTLGDMADSSGVVTAGADIYSVTPMDGINNYYIYNYGNVTFTGFGATGKDNITTDEGQLFVNTLIAAYEAGLVNPTVDYYETEDSNSRLLSSIAVPYDVNVTGRNDIDSSIQLDETGDDYLYKFVNPNTDASTAVNGTKAFFKVQDSNNVKGEKTCQVYFYLRVDPEDDGYYEWPNSTQRSEILQIQLNDNSVVDVVRIPIVIYDATDFTKVIGESNPSSLADNPYLEVGKMYGFYAPMSYLEDQGAVEIYIQANTGYITLDDSLKEVVRPLGTAYDMFSIIKQDLLKLD